MAKVVTATGLVGAFTAVIGGMVALVFGFFMYWPGIIAGIIAVIIGIMQESKS
jgi:hypothetical protein